MADVESTIQDSVVTGDVHVGDVHHNIQNTFPLHPKDRLSMAILPYDNGQYEELQWLHKPPPNGVRVEPLMRLLKSRLGDQNCLKIFLRKTVNLLLKIV